MGEEKQNGNAGYDVVISWKELEWYEMPNTYGAVSLNSFRFFWNNVDQGIDSKGLAVIYDRLAKMDNIKVLFESRSPDSPEDPINAFKVWEHFNRLFRRKNILWSIRYYPDDRDKLLPPWGNPFKDTEQTKKPTNRKNEGDSPRSP